VSLVTELKGAQLRMNVKLRRDGTLVFSYSLDNGQVKKLWTTFSVLRTQSDIQTQISGILMQSLVAVGNLLQTNCEPVGRSLSISYIGTSPSTSSPSETQP